MVGRNGKGGFLLVEQGFDEDRSVLLLFGTVEDELDVACHGIDAIVDPVVFEVVEVLHLTSATVKFQQTSERHDAHLVSETERGTILESLACHDRVGGLDDVVEQAHNRDTSRC